MDSITQQLDLAGSQPHTEEYRAKMTRCCDYGYGMYGQHEHLSTPFDRPDLGSYSHPDKMPGIHFNGTP